MTDLDSLWREILTSDPVLARRPSFRFDPDYYALSDPALVDNPRALRKHYRQQGKAEGRFPTRFRQLRAAHPSIGRRIRPLVTDPRLLAALEESPRRATELVFELMRLGYDAHLTDFSAEYYLKSNPDVARSGIPPLEHYLIHGLHEGRLSLGTVRRKEYAGARAFDRGAPTFFLALHELSNTGAPHVGLDIAREAAVTHNVVVAALRGGPLLDKFLETSCSVGITSDPFSEMNYFASEAFRSIDIAVCNSVEASPFVKFLVAREIPFACYIHEYATYTFPTYKIVHTALFADLLAFTSEHVRESWQSALRDVQFDIERDSVVIPQRRVVEGTVSSAVRNQARRRLSDLIGRDCTDLRVVCGAGQVQWRKGTDIFAMTAQIARHRDPRTIFVWVGDGLDHEDTYFGTWMTYHLSQAKSGDPEANLFMLPAGDYYRDVLVAADAMLLTSRLDPLPNVVFDGLEAGCEVVLFEGASGFNDASYRDARRLHLVEYGNPEIAASTLLALPQHKDGEAPDAKDDEDGEAAGAKGDEAAHDVFHQLLDGIRASMQRRRRLVLGRTQMDVPILYSGARADASLRTREREKLFTLGRTFLWKDVSDATDTLSRSDNWVHQSCLVTPYADGEATRLPEYSIHIHAYYAQGLPDELDAHVAFSAASRIVITTDSVEKRRFIETVVAARGLPGEVIITPNRGRDILPFLDLFRTGGPGTSGETWGHFHLKKSFGSTDGGDVWRQFMTSILLGSATKTSAAIELTKQPNIGLVSPLDPHVGQWNATRALLPKFAAPLPQLPKNPLVYPMGNMFWVKGEVVQAMNDLFPAGYAWPNEPIPNDGTEYHLIERLWPAVAAQCGLSSVFVAKPDQRRRL